MAVSIGDLSTRTTRCVVYAGRSPAASPAYTSQAHDGRTTQADERHICNTWSGTAGEATRSPSRTALTSRRVPSAISSSPRAQHG